MDKDDALLVSVDIGTSTVSVLVAEATPDGPAVLGLGTAPAQGVPAGLPGFPLPAEGAPADPTTRPGFPRPFESG